MRVFLFAFIFLPASLLAAAFRFDPAALQTGPTCLVLYDGLEADSNPGLIDARYLANLLGHFTTRRTIQRIETYKSGDEAQYDAVFVSVFQKKYTVPSALISDLSRRTRPWCWMGQQLQQLNNQEILTKSGLRYDGYDLKQGFREVLYKGRKLAKGDVETHLLSVAQPAKAEVVAWTFSTQREKRPYAFHSGPFWGFVDSPFSYSGENDRYLVLADLLHDILGVTHPEDHPALLRIEDINALTIPGDLEKTGDVIRKYNIPFSFAYVPMYVNPTDRYEDRMADHPKVVEMMQKYVRWNGSPVLHGYTHQYRGQTTDDYEFWDEIGDRPVRGDSEAWITRRLEEALEETARIGIYPLTWETPHYAASHVDYRVMRRFFQTVFERRTVVEKLGSDQLFPYPVVDLFGQTIIPENLGYVPIENPETETILKNAEAAWVVRDGFASFFYHPFLQPKLLDELISGVQKRGFRFISLREFPNGIQSKDFILRSGPGEVDFRGPGKYVIEKTIAPDGKLRNTHTTEVVQERFRKQVHVQPSDIYLAMRAETPPPGLFERILKLAKGDLSALLKKWDEHVLVASNQQPTRIAVLWNSKAKGEEAIDQEAFASAYASMGFEVEKESLETLSDEEWGPFTLLTVPQAAARTLTKESTERLIAAVKRGITLVTDGDSPLRDALGITLSEKRPVSRLVDAFADRQPIRWPNEQSVPSIESPSADELSIYITDDQDRPLVAGKRFGEGRYVYFSTLFDPHLKEGYSRFPSFPQILFDELHITPMARRQAAHAFFDPGYRQTVSIETLAKRWRKAGIHTVHVAAWHFYNKYSYDYARLIKVAHQNGILVYAWFEWPMVSERFWDEHPSWREKTATLRDARVDWRYLMNFQDPACLKAVIDDAHKFLRAYDWDGVNIAELTFDSPAGPDRPDTFTPMNGFARNEFKRLAGFDPIALFDPRSEHYWESRPEDLNRFYSYRRDVNTRMLKTFLETLRALDSKHGYQREIIVTVLDTLLHPELADFLAIDLEASVKLIRKFNATLQVEDPAADWALAPNRYDKLGALYREKFGGPFMIDINVLPVHSLHQKEFASAQPQGTEFLQLWQSASKDAERVCYYSEASIFDSDWNAMPYAMASKATVRKDGDSLVVNAPYAVSLNLGKDAKRFILDGQPWFCGFQGTVIVPAGQHVLSYSRNSLRWFDLSPLTTQLISISGELLGSRRVQQGLEIEYRSGMRCAIRVNKSPYAFELDGESIKLPWLRGDEGYTILAPPGQHHLRVKTQTVFLYFLEFTSVVLGSLIVLFGLASSGLLVFLVVGVLVRRRLRKIRIDLSRRQRGSHA